MTMASAPAIHLEGVVKTFPNPLDAARPIRAVDGISLKAGGAEASDRLIALVGPDGAGKSTFMRLLCGLEAPDEGRLSVLGTTPDPDNEDFTTRIAFMPQTLGLYKTLSCRENLEVFAGLRGFEGEADGAAGLKRRIAAMWGFQTSGIELLEEERQAGKLSGGMKQKLALASALLRIPDLLLLDEPTVGVDPLSRRELWSVVRRMLADTPMTCVFSTAYLEEAEAADRVLLFESGRIIADENPQSFISRANGRTYLLPLANRAEHDAQMLCRRLSEETAATRSDALFLDIVPRMGGAAATTLAPTLPVKDARVPAGFVPRQPSLEDAYALLTFPRAPKTANRFASPPSDASDALAASADDTAERPVVIRADGIARKFGNFVAVADTSFEVRRGEIFGLLGPNGAGKTTTFRMLCGLLVPSKGQIEVAGYDLRTAKAGARARIGYVAQKFSLYGKLSVEQNLRYFGRSYGFFGQALQDRIDASLEDFGLTDRRDTTAGSLSFGAKRDLSMACGLIHSPEILFLDEATSGADLASRRTFWRRINALAAAGTSVVVTTHFLEEAEYCDRFLIQDAGKVLALGTPREVKQRAAVLSAVSGQSLVVDRMSIEDAFVAIVEAGRRSQETPS